MEGRAVVVVVVVATVAAVVVISSSSPYNASSVPVFRLCEPRARARLSRARLSFPTLPRHAHASHARPTTPYYSSSSTILEMQDAATSDA